MTFETLRLTERDPIRAFLNQDRRMTAYAIGDLDDAFWPQSIFYGARRDGRLESVLLVYGGFDPPVLTAFGAAEGVHAIFEQQTLPEEIYFLCPPEIESALRTWYDTPNCHREWRMVLDTRVFQPVQAREVARIGPEHADALTDLYRQAAEPGEAIVAFDPWQIAHGAFFGVWDRADLIAAAGTHVWSPGEGVAAIGNVFTRPDCRGRGHATRCTTAVAREALLAGIDTVILNVRQDNNPAVHVYRKLGFRVCGSFLEGPGLKRG
ncbi:MAG: GNAT family N-acetyltransferase [Anaerolineae bacterium]|nr:GNAT family N-acetyltransferase [Anaerolineae bacterium]